MKYKIGDKVKLRNDLKVGNNYGGIDFLSGMKDWLNQELTIDSINYERNYTWEDFLKAPIGTKITLENEEILVKDSESKFENIARCISYERLRNFYNDDLGKIIKIEEPTYTTVYEPTEQVEEMTLEEVCKELGRNIKIVRRKNYEF